MKFFTFIKNGKFFLILGIVFCSFFISQTTFAANRYWIGADGASYNVSSNWTATDPADCSGTPSTVPTSSDTAIFDADCDSGITIDSSWMVGNISIVSGYTGIINQNADLSVYGDFTKNSGTWSVTSGTVIFTGNTSATVTSNGALGGTVIINKTSNNFTIATGTAIYLGDNPTTSMIGSNSYLTNNGTITVNSGTWTVMNVNTSYDYPATFINNGIVNNNGTGWIFTTNSNGPFNYTNSAGATTTYNGTEITFNGSLTQNGNFDLTGKTITFNGNYDSTLITSIFGASLILNKATNKTLTLGSDITVINATTTAGIFSNPTTNKTMTVTGNLAVADGSKFGGVNLNVIISASEDQNISVITGGVLSPLSINKTGGQAILKTNYAGSGAGGTMTVATGTLYLNGKTLFATTTVANEGEIQLQGLEAFTTPTMSIGSTVTYVGDGDDLEDIYYVNTNIPYYNLKINSTDTQDTFDIYNLFGPNLISYYSAEGNANDYFSRNNGTFGGNTTTISGGKYGQAFTFDGGGDYVDLGTGSTLDLGTTFTISAWVKPTTLKNYAGIVSKVVADRGGAGSYVLVNHNNGTIGAANGVAWSFSNNAGITAGNWYLLTWVLSGGNIYFYVNGVPYNFSSFTYTDNIAHNVFIGSWYNPSNSYDFSGLIDDVRIYNNVLSQSEISSLYNWNGVVATSTSLNLLGALTISSGIFNTPDTLNLAGDLLQTGGTFNATSTTLVLTGTNQIVSFIGTTTIANLTKSVTSSDTLIFSTSTDPLIITGTTTFSGTSGNLLSLRSAIEGTQWKFDPQGTRDFSYLDVQDSYNISSTAINTSEILGFVDSGNNTGWSSTQSTLTVSRQGSQVATTSIPTITNHQDLGGAFTFIKDNSTSDVTSIVLHQVGSLPADENISNLKLYYQVADTCSSTKPIDATLFGTGSTFVNNISTTTGTMSVGTSNVCVYPTYNIATASSEQFIGYSIDLEITNPSTDVVATGVTISSTDNINISGTTIIVDESIATSILSLRMNDPLKDPTVFYLKNNAVWKKEGDANPIRLTNPNLIVQALTFTNLTAANSGGTVKIELVISNMDTGNQATFLNVTRTYGTTATVKAW